MTVVCEVLLIRTPVALIKHLEVLHDQSTQLLQPIVVVCSLEQLKHDRKTRCFMWFHTKTDTSCNSTKESLLEQTMKTS